MAHPGDDGLRMSQPQLEALSWALAARLARRHPHRVVISHGRPGGGQNDVLWLHPPNGPSPEGDVRLNRSGTIRVMHRFDATPLDPTEAAPTPPTVSFPWARAAAGGAMFLAELERAAGLPAVALTPPTTARTLTWRILAALLAAAAPVGEPLTVTPGYLDTGSESDRMNPLFRHFPAIPDRLLSPTDTDSFGRVGYRFWFVTQAGEPKLAFEHSAGLAWLATDSRRGINLAAEYDRRGRAPGLLAVVGTLASSARLRLH